MYNNCSIAFLRHILLITHRTKFVFSNDDVRHVDPHMTEVNAALDDVTRRVKQFLPMRTCMSSEVYLTKSSKKSKLTKD